MNTNKKESVISCGVFLGVIFLFSCSDESSSGEPNGLEKDVSAASKTPFSIERLMDVQLTITGNDWDDLRYGEPGFEYLAAPDCPNGPRPASFPWYKATVTVDGVSYEEVKVRKKGFMGSMEPMKPSIKVKFGKASMPYGIRSMTLNNAVQDPSYARECLAYYLFDKAGLAAPRCGLARVHVNGEDFGVYTHIEEIKSPMLARHFGDGNGSRYEITQADFVSNLIIMFEYKNDSDDLYKEQLEKTASILEKGDDVIVEELGEVVDIDAFVTYWAMEVLTSHWDSYSGNRNNSYVYREPASGLYYFIPWGTDQSFNQPEDNLGFLLGRSGEMPWAVFAHGAIARRLYAHTVTRNRYDSTLRALLKDIWDEKELLRKIDTVKRTVSPALNKSNRKHLDEASRELSLFISSQKSRLIDALDAGLPDWPIDPNPPACFRAHFTFSGTLQTQFDTLEEDILETGTGNVSETTQSDKAELEIVRGLVGLDTESTQFPYVKLIVGFGPASNGKYLAMEVRVPKERFYESNTVSLDFGEARAAAEWIELPSQATTKAGYIYKGQMTFTKLDLRDHGRVEVAFEAPLYNLVNP